MLTNKDQNKQGVESRALYPIPEVRRLLGGISHTGFYELVKQNKLKLSKIGRRSFVSNSEINRFLEELEAL